MENQPSDRSDSNTLHATVRGRVQNVGFRAFVQHSAQRLDLRGYTRNMPDGSVEVVASGDRDALGQLLEKLKRGPASARVESVDHNWLSSEPEGLSPRFEVRG